MDWQVTDATDDELNVIQAQFPASSTVLRNGENLPELIREASASLFSFAREAVDREIRNDELDVTIRIVIFVSDTFNAWAGKVTETGVYYIALSALSYPTLGNLSALLLAGDTFSNVFKLQPSPKPALPRNVSSLRALSRSGPAPAMDEIRDRIAGVLGAKAVEFVILHEFVHIVHGHVDLVIDRLGTNTSISEGGENPRYDEFIFRQTLEFDADICGLRRLLRSSYDGFKVPPADVMVSKLGWRDACPVTAVFILNYYFDEQRSDPSTFWNRTHPIGAIRAHYLLVKSVELVSDFTPVEPDETALVLTTLLLNVPSAFDEVTGIDHKGINTGVALKEIQENGFYDRIGASWAQIRPELMQHKRTKDLPGISGSSAPDVGPVG